MTMVNNKRPVIVISLITAICLLGDSMLYVVLPIRWQDFGLTSLWEVGVLLSVNRLIRLPLNPLIGWMYKRMSKRAGILLAVLLAVVTTASYGMAGSFWLLFIIRSVWGIAWSFLRLGGYFTIIELSDKTNRGQFMGTFNGLTGIGSLIGMLAGSFAVEWFGIRNVTLVFGLAALVAVPFVLKYVSKGKTEADHGVHVVGGEQTLKIWREPFVVWTLVSGLMTAMVFQGMYNSTLSRLIQVHESTYVQLWTLSLGAASLAGILQAMRWGLQPWLSPWIGRRFDVAKDQSRMFVVLLVGASCLLAIVPFHMPFAVWLALLLGLQLGITAVSTVVDALATDASMRGVSKLAVMTGYTMATDLGASLGPSIAYTLDGIVGTSSIYWCAAAVLLLLAVRWLTPFQESHRPIRTTALQEKK
ncbi:MFS transporter [Paenibacillus sp. HJL G12]|uniref:MFS transporter n=1 Tax=Paenibacillus dendrobii TaxID=2691084 RepID=A0A7X3IPD4_9BACL|nr:MFS transporter [Paenibacillus dendrobii]